MKQLLEDVFTDESANFIKLLGGCMVQPFYLVFKSLLDFPTPFTQQSLELFVLLITNFEALLKSQAIIIKNWVFVNFY